MPNHPDAPDEIFLQDIAEPDDRLWVPVTDLIAYRPLILSASGCYWTTLTRIRQSGIVSRHRHPGYVHAHVLKGRWRYLEHDWLATAGSYVFEPPGETHTLVVEGDEEMLTIFHVHGSIVYLNEDGSLRSVEDVFSRIDQCRAHFDQVGLGTDYVERFIR
jgi:hypothetical protein